MMPDKIQKAIATLWFIGYLPYAPGTFSSALSFFLVAFLIPSNFELLLIFLPLLLLGLLSSHNVEKSIGRDSRHIVIDEFCGYLLSVLFIPKTINYLFAAFILFRIFDIVKPPPIRKIEKLISGGAGVMFDDIMAAVYSNICIQIWRWIF